MRPTDENQGASTRPNLMSSRRGAGEENILAMLERDSARRNGTRMTRGRLAWYCAAAAFSGILVGALAWLAYDNHETASALQVQVQAERVAEGSADQVAAPVVADAHPEPSAPAPAPTSTPAPAPAPATIVDQPHGMASAPPPLVMLPPENAKTTAPPAKTATLAEAAAPEPKPARSDQREALAKAGKPEKSDKPVKPERTAAARPQRPSAAKAPAPARTRKPAASAPADPAVDTDVALISAIIEHSERHRGERTQPAPCSGPKCPPPPPPRP